MTEVEWLQCDDWRKMLKYLTRRVGQRKVTLYMCAGLHNIWDLLYHDISRDAVKVAERFADGTATEVELDFAVWRAEDPVFGFDFDPREIRYHMDKYEGQYSSSVQRLLDMGVYTEADIRGEELRIGNQEMVGRLDRAAFLAAYCVYYSNPEKKSVFYTMNEYLVDLLSEMQDWPGGELIREVFGNPFRSTVFTPEWRTETVLAIARATYEERAYDRLPILADALEESGCNADELLAHLRGSNQHVLGCWALDLVLDKPA